MTLRRGVSLYSFQQSQFFKDLMLDDQIAEVGGIVGCNGIEIIDEMSLRYPDPGEAFVRHWFAMMDRHGTVPVAMDVGMDVLQFRDHVMTHEECAERLRQDIRLAKRLGFGIVRVLSVTPFEVMKMAEAEAERCDVRLGKEVHQPMALEGPQVTEIVEYAERSGSRTFGIVPDLGIYQFRPSEALLKWFRRKGASDEACTAVGLLSEVIRAGNGADFDVSLHTAGNIRSDFRRFITSGEAPETCATAFRAVRAFAEAEIDRPTELDFLVVGEALTFSRTSPETLRQMAGHVTHVHAKFYEMSEMPEQSGVYEDASIDTAAAVGALKAGGFDGWLNSEYEGQRYYQDRTRADLMSEVDQVRKHQSMLQRLIEA
jgi:hypothetical protein